MPLLVVVLGPTASGKTVLAVTLAQGFDGEIVNCDSVALYRQLDVGTAKPTREERNRVPHHLLDIASPQEPVTAGEYARQARLVLEEIKQRGKLPIVVGGTGLYLRALLEGLFSGPQRSEELRARLRNKGQEKGSGYLQKLLRRLDPAAATKIHSNDAPKLIRAIEVCIQSRQQMSKMWASGRSPLQGFRILRIGLNPERKALYERINQRAQRMFQQGLVEETAELLKKYGQGAAPLSSLGYRQAGQLLRREITREDAVAAAQRAHRNYAKRQITWFRREPDVYWLHGFGDERTIQSEAASLVERMISAGAVNP